MQRVACFDGRLWQHTRFFQSWNLRNTFTVAWIIDDSVHEIDVLDYHTRNAYTGLPQASVLRLSRPALYRVVLKV